MNPDTPNSQHDSRRRNVEAVELHHEVHGPDDGTPLLLLHGLGSSCRDWQPQLEALLEAADEPYRIIACDLRGHGRSPRPRERFGLQHFVADVEALLRKCEATPAHVLGLSMGAIVAIELATRHPDLVRSLLLVSCPPELSLDDRRSRRIYLQRRLLISLLGMPAVAWVLGRRLFPKPEQQHLRRQFRRRWRTNDRRSYLRSVHAIMGWRPPDAVGQVELPTTVICGARDYWSTERMQGLADRFPKGRLIVLPDAGHAANIECPGVFNREMLEFLASLPADVTA